MSTSTKQCNEKQLNIILFILRFEIAGITENKMAISKQQLLLFLILIKRLMRIKEKNELHFENIILGMH